ncbi:MAG: hypothetical protein HDR26_03450 [Lachnospiraceae bacterium]|nr:hypothetical protein [Lachnospiraceae bacterium]
MKNKIMVLCDREAEYVQQMTDYLKKKEDFPFEIHAYTEPGKMAEFVRGQEVELLVVSESVYAGEVRELAAGQVLILKESERGEIGGPPQTDKYQSAENIYRHMIGKYLERLPDVQGVSAQRREKENRARLVGLYSPIRRCLQTSFALSLGQALAGRYKTLYVSFEYYAGWNGLLGQEGGKDLSDLLYYLEEDEEKFRYRMRLVEKKTGALFYIPPVYAGQNLAYITAGQWKTLLGRIAGEGGYEYVILDLSEGLQGIFELLRMCDRIYTIICGDGPARSKVEQYEHLLRMNEFEDILEKTRKQRLPPVSEWSGIREYRAIHETPSGLEQFTKGELAAYVRKVIEEDLEGGDESV